MRKNETLSQLGAGFGIWDMGYHRPPPGGASMKPWTS
ncbi:hypothetical protein ACIPJM_21265 [Streptomyces halstedii]